MASKTRKRASNSSKNRNRYRGFMPASIALALCGALLALIYMLPAPKRIPPSSRPPFEEFNSHLVDKPAMALPSVPDRKLERRGPFRPKVAIIIDDMGYDYSLDEAFLRLDAPISYAFLPSAPNTKKLAVQAAAAGRDVLVHLPMEPHNGGINPGPGVLRLDMDFDSMLRTLKKDLDAVPGATGVNNHMGSKFTENRKAMQIVFSEVRRRHMFFVDSRTTAETVAYTTARQMGIPAGWRSVFLDHTPERKVIHRELDRLISEAFKHGQAIAIGHPVKATLQVLYRELPGLQRKVSIVPVHCLLNVPDK